MKEQPFSWYLCNVGLFVLLMVQVVFLDLSRDKQVRTYSKKLDQGPYDLIIKSVEDCSSADNPSTSVRHYWKIRRANRSTMAMNGYSVVQNITLDDDTKLFARLDQLTTNGWKKNFFSTNINGKGFCSTIEEFLNKDDLKRILASFGKEECPFPPGKYGNGDEVILKLRDLTAFPIFFYNTYRGYFYFLRPDMNPSEVGCALFTVDIVPKLKKTKNG